MQTELIPLFGGVPAGPELLIILLVLVLLFGANKIPKLARSTGQAMGEFQRGRQEIEEELKAMEQGENESDEEFAQRRAEREAELEEDTTETAETAEAAESKETTN